MTDLRLVGRKLMYLCGLTRSADHCIRSLVLSGDFTVTLKKTQTSFHSDHPDETFGRFIGRERYGASYCVILRSAEDKLRLNDQSLFSQVRVGELVKVDYLQGFTVYRDYDGKNFLDKFEVSRQRDHYFDTIISMSRTNSDGQTPLDLTSILQEQQNRNRF